jgi:hypothetical protein
LTFGNDVFPVGNKLHFFVDENETRVIGLLGDTIISRYGYEWVGLGLDVHFVLARTTLQKLMLNAAGLIDGVPVVPPWGLVADCIISGDVTDLKILAEMYNRIPTAFTLARKIVDASDSSKLILFDKIMNTMSSTVDYKRNTGRV